MPATVTEIVGSRPHTIGGQSSSIDLKYKATGCTSDQDAYESVAAAAPDTFRNMVRQTISMQPTDNPTLWKATVRYVPPGGQRKEPPATGESAYRFQAAGGQKHITQSLETLRVYLQAGDTGPLTMFGGAIGVTDDAIEGCDLGDTTGAFLFSETHYLPAASVNDTYKSDLFALAYHTNAATFRGFTAGQCLFLGVSGGQRGVGDWELTFEFAARPNYSDISVPGISNAIVVNGWEYMWTRFRKVKDTTLKMMVGKPVAVVVERVYRSGYFSNLGIGTS